jgi:Conserved TM helix
MNSLSPFMETVAGGVLALPDDFSPGHLLLPLAFAMPAIPQWLIDFGNFVKPAFLAAIVLVLGWIIAGIVASIVYKLLQKTTLDDKLSEMISGRRDGSTIRLDNIVKLIVEWLIKVLAIVAALNLLGLTQVSEPLNAFLNQVFGFLPKLGAAIGLLAAAYFIATIVKSLAVNAAESFDLDARLNSASAENTLSASDTLGNALYWFVFLFFLPIILGVLGLEGPLAPVQDLLRQLLSAIPQILTAVAFGAIGRAERGD